MVTDKYKKFFHTFFFKKFDKYKKKVYCIISYVYILWLVGLLLEKDDPDVKFHANQGIILSIFTFASLFIVKVLSAILFSIAPILAFATSFLQIALILISGTYIFLGVNNAIRGKNIPLPFIGEFFNLF